MKETSQKNYYAIIPAEIRYSELLSSSEKLLYAEITALSNQCGYCWASNNYFAKLYKVSPITISRWINNLKKLNFVNVKIDKIAGNVRHITLKAIAINNFVDSTINKNAKHNTIIKNTKINRFKSPSLSEVYKFFNENKSTNLEADKFYDYYESVDWHVGKKKMKKWEASARNWIRRSKEFAQKSEQEFPNEYNKKYEWSIKEDQEKLNKYYKHIRQLGYYTVHSPTSGTIWRKK